jgi:type IV pilus assembly protein PilA
MKALDRLRRADAFTLIELLVVIVVLGILMAVALPTFLRQQNKAKDSRTQQYLTNVWKSARAETVSNNGQYPLATTLSRLIGGDQPQLSMLVGSQSAAAIADHVVIDTSSTTNTLILYAQSASGTVFTLVGTATGGQTIAAAAPLTDTQVADQMLTKVKNAAASYNTANGGYVGMTASALQSYDGTISSSVFVKSANAFGFCAQYAVNSTTRNLTQAGTPNNGPCP